MQFVYIQMLSTAIFMSCFLSIYLSLSAWIMTFGLSKAVNVMKSQAISELKSTAPTSFEFLRQNTETFQINFKTSMKWKVEFIGPILCGK